MQMLTRVVVLIVACGAGLAAQTPAAPAKAGLDKKNPGYIAAKSMTTPWPFTVQDVIVRCEKAAAGTAPAAYIVTVRTAAGQEYALSDTAKAKGFKPFDPISAPNPKVPGTKISAGPILAFGVRLCD